MFMTRTASLGFKTCRPVMKRDWEPETDVFEPPQLALNKQMLHQNMLQRITRGLEFHQLLGTSLSYHRRGEIIMIDYQSNCGKSHSELTQFGYIYISQLMKKVD